MSATYLLVGLGEERYALGVEDVLEVAAESKPEPLPGAPPGVIGLQNLRGEILPVLDLGTLVGTGSREGGHAIVVVEHRGRRAALSVGSVLDVARLEQAAGGRDEPAPLRASVLSDGSLIGVIDIAALLDTVTPQAAQ